MATDENFIDFKCPYCTEAVSFATDTAGKIQECPECAEILIVPHESSEFGHKIPIPITTPRLILRRLADGDWKDLLEFMSDDELFRCSEGSPLGEEQIIQWLEADKAVKLTTPDAAFCLAMQLQAGGKVIGYVSLKFIAGFLQQATCDVVVSRSFQRQGFGTEAVNAVLRFCFEGIALHRVITSFDSRDISARRLFEKVGMRREGEFLKGRFVNGEWVDTVWLAMLSEEYAKSRSSPPLRSPV
jgi:ribosomal-protein-alanine N-acetyltransferase